MPPSVAELTGCHSRQILGTCLGFEFFTVAISGNTSILGKCVPRAAAQTIPLGDIEALHNT